MQFIGPRISILEKENELSIVIFSYRHKLKTILMIAWMIAFAACGIMAISEFTHSVDRDRKTFWLVFISFWVYFELLVLKALLWRLRGKEKIIISSGSVKIKRDIMGFERYKEYRTEQISDWKRIEGDKGSILNAYENAYWFVGGESIGFDYYGRMIRIGTQLTEEEISELLGKIRHFLT